MVWLNFLCVNYVEKLVYLSVCCLVEKLQKAVFIQIPGEGQYLMLIIAKKKYPPPPMGQYFLNLLPGRFMKYTFIGFEKIVFEGWRWTPFSH